MGVTCPVTVFEFVNVFSAVFISMVVKIYSDSVVEIHVIPYVQLLAWQWELRLSLRAVADRQKPRGIEYACTRAHTDTPACQHVLLLQSINRSLTKQGQCDYKQNILFGVVIGIPLSRQVAYGYGNKSHGDLRLCLSY